MSLVEQFVDSVCAANLKQGIEAGITQAGGVAPYLEAIADVIQAGASELDENSAAMISTELEILAHELRVDNEN